MKDLPLLLIFSGWIVFLLTALLFIIPTRFCTYLPTPMVPSIRRNMTEVLRIYNLCIPFYCIISLDSSMLQDMALPNRSLGMALVRNLMFIATYAVAATVSLYWIY